MSNSFAEVFQTAANSDALAATIRRAQHYANEQGHAHVTLEHLLLALTEDPDAALVLSACNVDHVRLKQDIGTYLGAMAEPIQTGHPQQQLPHDDLIRIFRVAGAAARQRGRSANGGLVLAAIVGDGRSPAAGMLRTQGMTFDEAVRALQQANAQLRNGGASDNGAAARRPHAPSPPSRAPEPLLRPDEAVPEPDMADRPHSRVALRDAIAANAGGRAAAPVGAAPPPPPHADPPHRPVDNATEQVLADARRKIEAQRVAGLARPVVPANPQDVESERDGLARLNRPQSGFDVQEVPPTGPPAGPVGHPMPSPPRDRTASYRDADPHPHPQRARAQGGPAAATAGAGQPAPQPRTQPTARSRQQRQPSEHSGRGPKTGQPTRAQTPRKKARSRRAGETAAHAADPTELSQIIPRRMREGTTETIEVRIARADIEAMDSQMNRSGYVEQVVARAMTIRLRAPQGGFYVEPLALETQWIENRVGLLVDEYAIWRWNVTPNASGRRQLQLSVALRTLMRDGHAPDRTLPIENVDVRVRGNFKKQFRTLLGWLVAAAVGSVVTIFNEPILAFIMDFVARLAEQ